VNRRFSGKLFPFAEYALPEVAVGDQIWISIPDDGQLKSNLDNSLSTAALTLSIATNAVTTMMIAYQLWYVAVDGIHWIQWLNK